MIELVEQVWTWQLRTALVAIGVALTLAGGLVAGHRVHHWLWDNAPAIGRLVPRDAGAWIGLAGAALLLLAA